MKKIKRQPIQEKNNSVAKTRKALGAILESITLKIKI